VWIDSQHRVHRESFAEGESSTYPDAVGVPHRGLPAFRQRAPRAGTSHWGCLRHCLARRVGNQGAAASL